MLLNERSKYTDWEIIEKGTRVLIKELGYSSFLRFIRKSEGKSFTTHIVLSSEVLYKFI